MPALNLAPTLSFISALSAAPLRPLHTLVRTTEERFRPPQIAPHRAVIASAHAAALATGQMDGKLAATVLREVGSGRLPTIVLGGFVPDATEQVFLLRRFLLRSGDVYYVNYPREGFSLDLLCAQLDDLVAEVAGKGQAPVVFGVSFGAGIVLEWLRRARRAEREAPIAGVVMVSPVGCVADIIAPGAAKPSTLVGRALRPYLEESQGANEAAIEKSRAVFTRMFEAGAQNKLALRLLMTTREVERLRSGVQGAIRGITGRGARERVQALQGMPAPTEYFSPALLPLTTAPVVVLFAEKEDAVLDALSPTRFALERAAAAYFPRGRVLRVATRSGESAVQHASLIFHVFDFLPPLQAFYRRVRRGPLALAA